VACAFFLGLSTNDLVAGMSGKVRRSTSAVFV
jgi:hypothetical protein